MSIHGLVGTIHDLVQLDEEASQAIDLGETSEDLDAHASRLGVVDVPEAEAPEEPTIREAVEGGPGPVGSGERDSEVPQAADPRREGSTAIVFGENWFASEDRYW